MQVKLAEYAGFCFGVKRAIDTAMRTVREHREVPIYTLGPLIHNPQVVARLARLGIQVADSIEDIDSGIVIIRSHGVPPEIMARAREKGLKIVDATCPFVVRAMRWAAQLNKDGYQVVIVGERDHPEVIAVLGCTNNRGVVVANPKAVSHIPKAARYGVVAQTTQSLSNYRACVAQLVGMGKEIKVYDTICTATAKRQQAARELASQVDVMLVVGGRNSANTTRLAQICKEGGARTYHIETQEEIDENWFHPGEIVGVTAGASTPNWLIEEVVERMTEFEEKREQEVKDTQAVTTTESDLKSGVESEEKMTAQGENAAAVADSGGDAAVNPEGEEVNEASEEVAEPADTAEVNSPQTGDTAENKAAEAADTADTADEGEEAKDTEEAAEETEIEAPTMAQYDETFNTPNPGDIVKGKVVQVNDNEVLVHVGGKSEGRIPKHELGLKPGEEPADKLAVGDEINVYVVRMEDNEGNVLLSKRRADQASAWEELERHFKNGEIIEAPVTERVKGGLLVDVGVRGFVPASHVARNYVEDLEAYVGKTLRLKIIELDKHRNNVVLSHREVLEEEYHKAKEHIFSTLKPGDIVKGVVRRLTDFGAFVDIGSGVEGLLHVSEMAYSRVGHPSDVLSEGDEINVMVLNLDKDSERISLGLKQTLPDPWDNIGEKYREGDIVTGEVTRTVEFGAFVKLEDGVEGLVHISQLADRHVAHTEEVVHAGEHVRVKILSIDENARRIGLSIKEAQPKVKPTPSPQPEAQKEEEPQGTGVTIGDLVGDLGSLFNNNDNSENGK